MSIAEELESARTRSRAIPPVRARLSGLADAYSVQREWAERRVRAGARVVGRKIGLTSRDAQAKFDTEQPDFGMLFDDMAIRSGDPVVTSSLIRPRVEAEVAFVLERSLADPRVELDEVRGSVAYVVAALEIVDSRVADWDITLLDTVADNASSGCFVLGDVPLTLHEVAPAEVTVTVLLNGELAATGSGASCMGDPLRALTWLARVSAESGQPLAAGDLVLAGALGPMVPVSGGDDVHADFGALGEVRARFS